MSRWLIWVLLGAVLLLGACQPGRPEPALPDESTPTPPPATVTPAATATPMPTPEPLTPTPEPTDAPVWPALDPLDPAPETWDALEQWLVDAWLEGRNPAEVQAALQDAGWQHSSNELRTADLTGDGLDEWILLLHDITLDEDVFIPVFGAPGDLWVLYGTGLLYEHHAETDVPTFEAPLLPELLDLADLTGNGLPELIVMDSDCGAHTCFGFIRVIGLTDGEPQSLVQGAAPADDWIEISFPEVWIEPFQGQDALHVHGGHIGSVGAGIMRSYTEVWAWDGDAIVLQETLLDPTDYRHLILYEGLDAMAAGDLDGAAALFEDAAMSPDLDTVSFMGEDPDELEAAIRQFAAFRLILVRLLQEDMAEAESVLAWLEGMEPGAPLTLAARRLVEEWAGPEEMDALCAAIQAELEAYDEPTGPLEYQGYGNPSLTAEDICELS